jgi:hypothetical protein
VAFRCSGKRKIERKRTRAASTRLKMLTPSPS